MEMYSVQNIPEATLAALNIDDLYQQERHTHTHTCLHKRSDGAERAGAAELCALRTQQDGGVEENLTSLHLHLHQTILVPGTVLHQVNQQAQTLNTHTLGVITRCCKCSAVEHRILHTAALVS